MNEFFENAMTFINENTMLLIGICIFLILVLIGYLIDNSIKTRKLERIEMEKLQNEKNKPVEPVAIPEPVVSTTEVASEAVEVAPIIGPEKEEKEIEKAPENYVAEVVTEEAPVVTEIEEEQEVSEPAIETSSMKELLNKDFSKNAEIVNNLADTQIIKPVKIETPEPVIETKVEEEKKSPYKSNSKLSDILAKKKETPKPILETTQDFSDELDRILNKLNEESEKTNNSIDLEDEINNRF